MGKIRFNSSRGYIKVRSKKEKDNLRRVSSYMKRILILFIMIIAFFATLIIDKESIMEMSILLINIPVVFMFIGILIYLFLTLSEIFD